MFYDLLNLCYPMLYENNRTRTFSQIFPKYSDFKEIYNNIGIPTIISDVDDEKGGCSLKTLYYLLLARYANSPISSSDETRFKLNVFELVFRFGPTWEKNLSIQERLRNMSDDELLEGSKQLYNHANNPSTAPTTDTTDELDYIDDQNVTKTRKGKLDGYGLLMALLREDVTGKFIGKFKDLFNTKGKELPLWYVTEIEEV